MADPIVLVRDPFSESVRQTGALAAQIEQLNGGIKRLRELHDSARGQAEHFLAEREALKAELEHARRDAANERATAQRLREQLAAMEAILAGQIP